MEQFRVNNELYTIKWYYEHFDKIQKNEKISVHLTHCDIFDSSGIFINNGRSEARGNFSKRFGRNRSLKRALLYSFNREDRKKIWSQVKQDFKTSILPPLHFIY